MRDIQLVAHRGYSHRYPENTLIAFRKAIECGCLLLELDVQLTQDQVPVVLHDEDLERTTNIKGLIYETDSNALAEVTAGEESRLGTVFSNEPLPTLAQFAQLLLEFNNVTAFVEIKEESVRMFGSQVVVSKILEVLRPVLHQVVIIGYGLETLLEARKQGKKEVGWVLTSFSDDEKHLAEKHEPDYLICNYTKFNTDLWPGPWRWFIYEVTDWQLAQNWFEKGVDFIETMQIKELIDQRAG